jgi:polysaccharide biosynthesis protein PslG
MLASLLYKLRTILERSLTFGQLVAFVTFIAVVVAIGITVVIINPAELIAQNQDTAKFKAISTLSIALKSYVGLSGTYPATGVSWQAALVTHHEIQAPITTATGIACRASDSQGNRGDICYKTTGKDAFIWANIQSHLLRGEAKCANNTVPVLSWSASKDVIGLTCLSGINAEPVAVSTTSTNGVNTANNSIYSSYPVVPLKNEGGTLKVGSPPNQSPSGSSNGGGGGSGGSGGSGGGGSGGGGNPPPPPPPSSSLSSHYGFTSAAGIDQDLVYRYKLLNINWVRLQIPWKDIETSAGSYNWNLLDQQVKTANAAGIHITYPIQDAPSFRKTVLCAADGKAFLPNPQDTAYFASLVAKRYNGQPGSQGYIDSYEIFNEEPTLFWDANIGTASYQCRTASYYVPQLKAGYAEIKGQSPNALVGMLGYWWESISGEQKFMQDMYAQGAKGYFDFANFHYYTQGKDPRVTQGDVPSFHDRWQTMHNVMVANGDGAKPIWVTETGFFASDGLTNQQIEQYMLYELQSSQQSGVVAKFFWYTINTYRSLFKDQGKDLYPNWPTNNSPTPAFYTYQAFINQHPTF